MKKLVFATNNAHKLNEIRKIVSGTYEIMGLNDIGCKEDIPETAGSLEGNADLKAMHVYNMYGFDCFADDTGLEVESLGGRPGVFSARYAGEEGNAEKNIEKLLREMHGIENRKARFRTVISLIIQGKMLHFEGIVEGKIIREKRGNDGFGYDPLFIPNGYNETFAEMPLEIKNQISHRGRAMKKLLDYLMTNH